MKDLLKSNPKSSSLRDRLLAFFSGQEIVLTIEEEKMKKRLNFVREKLWDWSLNSEDIIKEVVEVFSISKYRAERDIADANYIFGKTLVIDPGFVAGQMVEDIKQTIALAKTARKFDMLPKLYDSLAKAVALLPKDTGGSVKAKTIKIYHLHGNAAITPTMPAGDALQKARDMMKHDFAEDITHEEVSDED